MPHKGYKHTKEHIEKNRQSKLKNPTRYWLGKKRDENTKIKISKNRTGKCIGDNNPSKRPEVREKIGKSSLGRNKGENSGNWQNGKSFEKYGFDWTDDLKENIRQRDLFICQLCGTHQDELDFKLDCHHIDYEKKNLNPNNLITLCRSCHIKTNYNRNYWTNYFKNKLMII